MRRFDTILKPISHISALRNQKRGNDAVKSGNGGETLAVLLQVGMFPFQRVSFPAEYILSGGIYTGFTAFQAKQKRQKGAIKALVRKA